MATSNLEELTNTVEREKIDNPKLSSSNSQLTYCNVCSWVVDTATSRKPSAPRYTLVGSH